MEIKFKLMGALIVNTSVQVITLVVLIYIKIHVNLVTNWTNLTISVIQSAEMELS